MGYPFGAPLASLIAFRVRFDVLIISIANKYNQNIELYISN